MNPTARRRSLLDLRACGDGPRLPQFRLNCYAAFEYLIRGRKNSDPWQIAAGALIEAIEALRLLTPQKFDSLTDEKIEDRICERMRKAVKAFKRETKCGIAAPSSTNATRKRNGQEPYAPILREYHEELGPDGERNGIQEFFPGHWPARNSRLNHPQPVIVGSERGKDAHHYIPSRYLEYQPYDGDDDSPHGGVIEIQTRERDAILYFGPFTPQQVSILKLLWDGFSQQQAAAILGVPLHWIKDTKAELAERAGVASLMRRSA